METADILAAPGFAALRRRHLVRSAAALAVTAVSPALLAGEGRAAAGEVVVASGIKGGKGVVALGDGSFIAPEFVTGNILRISAAGDKQILTSIGFGAAGAAPGPDGSVFVCKMSAASMGGGAPGGGTPGGPPGGSPLGGGAPSQGSPAGGVYRFDLASNLIKPLYLNDAEGKPLPGPNDLVFDRYGDFWFSDYAAGKVYCARADGSGLRLVVPDLPGAHGIVLSPDRSILYVIFTGAGIDRQNPPKKIAAYVITGRAALDLASQRVLGPFAVAGQFDGLRMEAGGNLLAASWQGGIVAISPDGKLLGQTAVGGGKAVISVTFRGPDLRQLVCMVNGAGGPGSGFMIKLPWPRAGLRLVNG